MSAFGLAPQRLRAQRLIVTLLGDYRRDRVDPIPSRALMDVLAEFGVESPAARSALSRVTRRGLLVRSRAGRRTFYHLTPRARRELAEGAERIFSFGTTDPVWDGRWSVVAFSVAERDRHLREQLRNRLRWFGFAPLYDGVWVSPHDRLETAAALLEDLGIKDAALLRAEAVRGLDRGIERSWDLDAVRRAYDAFLARFTPARQRLEHGGMSVTDALVVRTNVMNDWRAFPRLDPDLPRPLLPADWPRKRARQLFMAIYEGLALAAERRFAEIAED